MRTGKFSKLTCLGTVWTFFECGGGERGRHYQSVSSHMYSIEIQYLPFLPDMGVGQGGNWERTSWSTCTQKMKAVSQKLEFTQIKHVKHITKLLYKSLPQNGFLCWFHVCAFLAWKRKNKSQILRTLNYNITTSRKKKIFNHKNVIHMKLVFKQISFFFLP